MQRLAARWAKHTKHVHARTPTKGHHRRPPRIIPLAPARPPACPPGRPAARPQNLFCSSQVAFTVASAVSVFSMVVKIYIMFQRRQLARRRSATRRASIGGIKVSPALANATSAQQLKADFSRVRMEQVRYLSYLLLLFLEGPRLPSQAQVSLAVRRRTAAALCAWFFADLPMGKPNRRIALLVCGPSQGCSRVVSRPDRRRSLRFSESVRMGNNVCGAHGASILSGRARTCALGQLAVAV
jgi:hypothetical protein